MGDDMQASARTPSHLPWPSEQCRISAAAHDLRNHLQVVSSALAILQRAAANDAAPMVEQALAGARASLDQALQLSTRIVRADQPEEQVDPFSIADCMQSFRDVVVLACQPSIQLEFNIAADTPEVRCSRFALENAVLNVVANACHAMPHGGLLSISVFREFSAPDMLPIAVVRIADSGCGMPPDVARRAFERHFTARHGGGGSGIGLATAADFASEAGGMVELQSMQNIGTVVTLRLPGVIRSMNR